MVKNRFPFSRRPKRSHANAGHAKSPSGSRRGRGELIIGGEEASFEAARVKSRDGASRVVRRGSCARGGRHHAGMQAKRELTETPSEGVSAHEQAGRRLERHRGEPPAAAPRLWPAPAEVLPRSSAKDKARNGRRMADGVQGVHTSGVLGFRVLLKTPPTQTWFFSLVFHWGCWGVTRASSQLALPAPLQ